MGKDRKAGRGNSGRGSGKKMHIANEDELALREREVDDARKATARRRAGSDDEGGAAGEDSDDSGDEKAQTVFDSMEGMSLGYQGGKVAGGASKPPANANKKIVAPPMTKLKNMGDAPAAAQADAETAGFNRKEREAIAAAKAKEDYMARHRAGETEEAKRQLAQLAIVKARREAAKAKREAEGRAPGMSATGIVSDDDDSDDSDDSDDVKKPAAKAVVATGAAGAEQRAALAKKEANDKKKEQAMADQAAIEKAKAEGPPKLKGMDIKKMNGDALKEACKERDLNIQGSKKDLMSRLTAYEAAR